MSRKFAMPGLAALIVVGIATCGAAAAGSSTPPDLLALEQKMRALQIGTERYSITTRGSEVVRVGKREKHLSLDSSLVGAVNLTPPGSEVLSEHAGGVPLLIVLGADVYENSPQLARIDPGHRWIRLARPADMDVSFPFHQESFPPSPASEAKNGSYAGLLAQFGAAREIREVGPSLVAGQPTTEFSMRVEPLALIKGLSKKEKAALRQSQSERSPDGSTKITSSVEPLAEETLEIFLTEAGLPVRAIETARVGDGTISSTDEILAVNQPLPAASAPPASETLDESQFLHLLEKQAKHAKRGGTGKVGH